MLDDFDLHHGGKDDLDHGAMATVVPTIMKLSLDRWCRPRGDDDRDVGLIPSQLN